jgi:hypothetical protein
VIGIYVWYVKSHFESDVTDRCGRPDTTALPELDRRAYRRDPEDIRACAWSTCRSSWRWP